MPKSSIKRRDANVTAFDVVAQAIGEVPRAPDPRTPKKGQAGGLKGGVARAKNLPPEKRIEIAKKAARKRWAKKPVSVD
jgi:hypothetical protein